MLESAVIPKGVRLMFQLMIIHLEMVNECVFCHICMYCCFVLFFLSVAFINCIQVQNKVEERKKERKMEKFVFVLGF